jgi:hypothetical protein
MRDFPKGEYFLEIRDATGAIYGERFSSTIRENFSVGVGDSFTAQPVLLSVDETAEDISALEREVRLSQ